MSVKWEKTEGNTGVLTFEVSAEKFNQGLDEAFKKVVKQINVPGFRKGKVPRQMFNKMYGEEALYQDALDIVLPEAYSNAVEEAGIDPVDQPSIDLDDIEKGKPVVFKATVTVKPEVTLGDYKGLEVKKQDTEVTDEEIEEQLKDQQQRFAELVVKEDAIVEGDTAVIDFEGFVDGEAFEGGKAEGYSLEIGSGSFIPGFEEQLVGLKAGEEKDVEVTFPEEYHAAELAGKPAVFKTKVHEVKGKELPELNDEFAKEVDPEVEGIDALRAKIKERTAEEKKNAAETALRDELVETAAANATIDVPHAMVHNEEHRMIDDFSRRLESQGMNLDLYYQFSGQTHEDLHKQFHEDAEKRVRVSLTLEAIAAAENIEVTEEEVNEELNNMSSQFNMSIDQIKAALGGVSMLENDLRMQKTIDFLAENAKVTE